MTDKRLLFCAVMVLGACGSVDPSGDGDGDGDGDVGDVDAGPSSDGGTDGGGEVNCTTRLAVTQFGGGQDVFTVNADGSSLTNITDPGAGQFPAWSPDGRKIAFTSSFTNELTVANADGSGVQELTAGRFANWSPDGTKIAFTQRENAQDDIYVINADGTGETQLTNLGGLRPVWTPDGARIVFEADRDGDRDIFVMNANGTGQSNLSNNDVSDSSPFVSPDSSVVIYTSNGALGIVNINGTGRDVQALGGIVQTAEFSPDGSFIVAAVLQGGQNNIVVSALDGSNPLVLGEGSAPTWSPDGANIGYLDSDSGVAVATANTAASGATIVTGSFLDVHWSPCER